jgi:hypothetical protein
MAIAKKPKTMTIVTPTFRVSYPNVFKPKKNELSGKDEFVLDMWFEKDTDLTALRKAIDDAIVSAWPDEEERPEIPTPFRDGDKPGKNKNGKAREKIPGVYILKAKSKDAPEVVDCTLKAITDTEKFYAGCYARAQLNIKCYDYKGSCGIGIYVNKIQKLDEGQPLGNVKQDVKDVFDVVVSKPSDIASNLDDLDEDELFDTEYYEIGHLSAPPPPPL